MDLFSLRGKVALITGGRGSPVFRAIGPTYIRTQLTAAFVDRPEIRERILRFTPAGRLGRCEDLVGTAVYLASSASDLVTGQTIFVDGGYTAV